MINICITATYNILDGSYGGGSRVLGLLDGLNNIDEINKIVILYPFADAQLKKKNNIFTYFSHRKMKLLKSIHNVSIIDDINPFKTSSLIKIINKYHIDIIQNENIWGGISVEQVAKCFKIPFIIDDHNFESYFCQEVKRNKLIQLYTRNIEYKLLHKANHVLMVSEKDKKDVHKVFNLPLNKISVITNGLNTKDVWPVSNFEKENAKRKFNISDKFVLVFHGSLDFGPNQEAVELILNYVFPELVKKIPNIFFLIIGRCHKLMNYISDNASDFIYFTGFVNNLREYLAAADVAIIPICKGGGTKLKIFDYLGMGIPIVATKKAMEGINLENYDDSFIIDEVNHEFIDSIFYLFENPNVRDILSKKSFQNSKKYSWDAIARDLYQVYLKTLG